MILKFYIYFPFTCGGISSYEYRLSHVVFNKLMRNNAGGNYLIKEKSKKNWGLKIIWDTTIWSKQTARMMRPFDAESYSKSSRALQNG